MADVKISELPALTSSDGAEELVVNDGGTTKKITGTNLLAGYVSKNSTTGAASMPSGTTAQRPSGALGMFRHNSTLDQFEGYNDGEWGALAGGGELSKITYEFIATAGQTSFTGSDLNSNTLSYTVGSIIVSYGGLDLAFSDYTATNGSSITLADGAVVGKIVRIVAFTTFAVADTYTQSQADVLLAAKSPIASPVFTGNVGIGVTPQANWHSNYDAVAIGEQSVLYAHADGIGNDSATYLGTNVYENNGSKYLRTDKSSLYRQQSGKHDFYVAPSGTADAAISWNTAMTIDNSGNVGIGVVPESDLNTGSYSNLRIGLSGLLQANISGHQTFLGSNYKVGNLGNEYIATGASARYMQAQGAHYFSVAPSGTADAAISFTNAMTINNTDDVVVGNFTTNGSEGGVRLHYNNYADGSGAIFTSVTNTATRGHFWFYNPNGQVGTITTNGSSTSYNTSSDYRLKENVTPMSGATAQTKLLKPCNFDWIVGGNVNGFIAHELAEVVPEAVSGTKDAMRDEEYEVTPAVLDDEGNETTAAVMGTRSVPDMQGIDQSKLVPLLTATIQELIARIEALEGAAP